MNDDLIQRAAALAREVHADQKRKGTEQSYFEGHLEPVAEFVREAGGSDVQVAAAYLHDAAEDGGGQPRLDQIRDDFGDEVADIVGDLSDSLVDTTGEASTVKESWSLRKTRYIEHLAGAPVESLEVSAADKLHNAQSILDDYGRIGAGLWQRFNQKQPEYQLWYYRSLAQVFRARIPAHPLTDRLDRCVQELEAAVAESVPDIADRVARASSELDG